MLYGNSVFFIFFKEVDIKWKESISPQLFQLFLFCPRFPESSDATADLTANNGGPVQVKKEEEEEEEEKTEPPAAKRKRGQTKSQIKTKEEIKSEGNRDLIIMVVGYCGNVIWWSVCFCFLLVRKTWSYLEL